MRRSCGRRYKRCRDITGNRVLGSIDIIDKRRRSALERNYGGSTIGHEVNGESVRRTPHTPTHRARVRDSIRRRDKRVQARERDRRSVVPNIRRVADQTRDDEAKALDLPAERCRKGFSSDRPRARLELHLRRIVLVAVQSCGIEVIEDVVKFCVQGKRR